MRLLKLGGAAAALALALTGCGNSGGTAPSSAKGGGGDQATSVSMWVYPLIADQAKNQTFWDAAAADFKKQHPNVDVKVSVFPWANRDQALTTALAAGKGPDLVYLIPDQLAKYQAQGVIEPVGDYLDASVKSSYRDNVVSSVTMDGKMLGAPVLMSAVPAMCDKRAFEKAGVTDYPKTWDDLMAIAPKFKAAGIYVTEYAATPDWSLNQTFYPWLWQSGGDVFSQDGSKVAFDSPAGVEALTYLRKLIDAGYVDKTTLTQNPPPEQSPQAKGKIACLFHLTPADVAPFWGKNTVVLPPLTDKAQKTYGTVGSFSMLKGAKDKKAAGEWLSYVTSDDVIKKLDTAGGFFSPKKTTGSLYPNDPIQAATEKILDTTTVGPLNPKARDIMGALSPEIQAALLGKKTPEQALKDAAAQAQQLLGS